MTYLLICGGLTVLISAICSLLEATLYSTRMSALEAERADGERAEKAERFIAMKADIARPTSAILVLNTIANTAGAAICGMLAARLLGAQWVPAFSVGLVLAILFVGEILPKTYGATHWRSIWHRIVWPLVVLQKVLSPAVKITQKFADLFTGARGTPAITEDEIQASIELGGQSGELTPSELELLSAVFRFDDMLTRQVMVPRRDVVFLDVRKPASECFELARKSRHTRFPLCEGSLDEVVGLVHIKDLLGLAADENLDLRSVSRELCHVPETMPISELMHEMQNTHQHMALVDDEYGSVVGIVTMENVVEQIVGAVQDEFDSEAPEVEQESPGVYLVNGSVPLERLNREVSLSLESTDVDTLSGLLVSRIGRLLGAGDTVELEGATAEVIEEQGGHAVRVKLMLQSGDEGADL
ncbi:MAG: hemolysin family protein [Bryobacterales bacterium]|nr:hemolysin family protein [Bryobacterales bacterium]MDE0261605.1 hemolysin family protein [Bryobacterales bacterium]MDE0624688.1 hemolysin family protein [Bryobacterales bacterium]